MSVYVLNVINPLPDVFRSSEDKNNLYDTYKLLPYRGSTKESSHGFLKLLYDLYELSPSHATCCNNIKRYGFEGDVNLERVDKVGLVFSDSDRTLSDPDKMAFCDFLESLSLNVYDIINLSQQIALHLKISGNAWVDYMIANVNGETSVTLKVIDPRCIMYSLEKSKDQVRKVVCANRMDENHLGDPKKHSEISVFPNFDETRFTKRTVFHIKNEDALGDWYGLPDSIESLRWQFVEYQLNTLSCKVSSTEFTAKKILVVPMPPPENAEGGQDSGKRFVKAIAKGLRNVTQVDGDDSNAIAVMAAPEGKSEMHDLDINRDTDWFKSQVDTASGYIYASHNDNRQLTGFKEPTGSRGDVTTQLWVKYQSVVKKYQDKVSNELLKITNQIAEDTGRENFKGIKMVFPDNIEQILTKITTQGNEHPNIVE